MSTLSELRTEHELEVDSAAWDDGFVRGFKEGAGHAMNFIQGWQGETRNPFDRGVPEAVRDEWLSVHHPHGRSF